MPKTACVFLSTCTNKLCLITTIFPIFVNTHFPVFSRYYSSVKNTLNNPNRPILPASSRVLCLFFILYTLPALPSRINYNCPLPIIQSKHTFALKFSENSSTIPLMILVTVRPLQTSGFLCFLLQTHEPGTCHRHAGWHP